MTIKSIVNGQPQEKVYRNKLSFVKKKGSARSRSATRGYDKQFGDKAIPFRQQNDHIVCNSCSNKLEAGQKTKGHMAGDLICPNVQNKKYPVHSSWINFKDKFLIWIGLRRSSMQKAIKGKEKGKKQQVVEKGSLQEAVLPEIRPMGDFRRTQFRLGGAHHVQ